MLPLTYCGSQNLKVDYLSSHLPVAFFLLPFPMFSARPAISSHISCSYFLWATIIPACSFDLEQTRGHWSQTQQDPNLDPAAY